MRNRTRTLHPIAPASRTRIPVDRNGILAARDAGDTVRAISARFGVSREMVRAIGRAALSQHPQARELAVAAGRQGGRSALLRKVVGATRTI